MSQTLKDTITNVEKRFGKDAIAGKQEGVKFTPIGSYKLDPILGGGLPKGRIVEFYGENSSGKSTLALYAAANTQREGKIVVYVDMENAIDPEYAEMLGVDMSSDKFILCQPDYGEQAMEIAREFIKCKDVGLVIVDSVSSLVPKAVIEGEAGEAKLGLLARMMSSMLPTIVPVVKKSDCTVLFINQLREKIGVIFGDSRTTSGGKALGFYASVRVEVSKAGQIKEGDEIIGQKLRIKTTKNKVFPPFKKAETELIYGIGIDIVGEVFDICVEKDIIKKGGSWYSYGETKLGQGAAYVKNLLRDNPELFEELKSKIK